MNCVRDAHAPAQYLLSASSAFRVVATTQVELTAKSDELQLKEARVQDLTKQVQESKALLAKLEVRLVVAYLI